MRFLANENFPGDAVAALKAAGHDIVWVRTVAPGSKSFRRSRRIKIRLCSVASIVSAISNLSPYLNARPNCYPANPKKINIA